MSQPYFSNVLEEQIIRGNSALIKCHLPAFVGDFVHVSGWLVDGQSMITNNEDGKFSYGRVEALGGRVKNESDRTGRHCARAPAKFKINASL